jgi:hypothetical protein
MINDFIKIHTLYLFTAERNCFIEDYWKYFFQGQHEIIENPAQQCFLI